MEYTKKAEWGARKPRWTVKMGDTNVVYAHHSVTRGVAGAAECRQMQNDHMDKKRPRWSDIAYHWLYDDTGTIYEGRGWNVQGGATYGHNDNSIALCYIGNAHTGKPTVEALAAFERLMAETEKRMGPQWLRPHNAVSSTACPGKYLVQYLKDRERAPIIVATPDWRDETAFIMAMEQKYEHIADRPVDSQGYDSWMTRFLAGEDPGHLLRAMEAGLRLEVGK